jgi:hypothetical protein
LIDDVTVKSVPNDGVQSGSQGSGGRYGRIRQWHVGDREAAADRTRAGVGVLHASSRDGGTGCESGHSGHWTRCARGSTRRDGSTTTHSCAPQSPGWARWVSIFRPASTVCATCSTEMASTTACIAAPAFSRALMTTTCADRCEWWSQWISLRRCPLKLVGLSPGSSA